MRNCPSCGKAQSERAAFCTICGAVLDRPYTLEAPATPGPPAPPTPSAPDVMRPIPARPEFGDVGVYLLRRLLALVVDFGGVGFLLASGALLFLEQRAGVRPNTFRAFVELAIVTPVALFLYLWLFEALFGSTLGKALFNLGVGRPNGKRAGFGRTFVRNLLLPLDLLVIGFLLATVTRMRQRLGDLVAGTVVANTKIGAAAPLASIVALAALGYADYKYAQPLTAAQRLVDDTQKFAPALVGRQTPPPEVEATPSPAPTSAATPSPPLPSSSR